MTKSRLENTLDHLVYAVRKWKQWHYDVTPSIHSKCCILSHSDILAEALGVFDKANKAESEGKGDDDD